MTQQQCPICWRMVSPTRWRRIPLHRDAIGRDVCPASSEPFYISTPPPLVGVESDD